jgi:hypothetical protein
MAVAWTLAGIFITASFVDLGIGLVATLLVMPYAQCAEPDRPKPRPTSCSARHALSSWWADSCQRWARSGQCPAHPAKRAPQGLSHTSPPCMLQAAIAWSKRTIETRGQFGLCRPHTSSARRTRQTS